MGTLDLIQGYWHEDGQAQGYRRENIDSVAESHDIAIVRDLARRVADIARQEKQAARRELWRSVNSLRPAGVPVYLRWGGWWEEIIRPTIQCEQPFWREHEFSLRTRIVQDELDDDSVIEPWLTQKAVHIFPNGEPWGVRTGITNSEMPQGAYHIEPPLRELEDLARLATPSHQIDESATRRAVERVSQAVDGILTVNVDRAPFYRFFDGDISTQLSYLRGIENLMYDIYDNPDWIKRLVAFLAEGIEKAQVEAEMAGDWQLANQENQAMPYVDELPDPQANSGGVSRKRLWCYMAGQEFTMISPEHFNEILLAFQVPILERFGLSGYGCCEDITRKIPYLRQIPNLRRIAITAFSDCAVCAEQIARDYVASWRPNPSTLVCNGFDEAHVRESLCEGVRMLRTHHCAFDISLKDVETVGGDITRLKRFVKIAREVCTG